MYIWNGKVRRHRFASLNSSISAVNAYRGHSLGHGAHLAGVELRRVVEGAQRTRPHAAAAAASARVIEIRYTFGFPNK